MNRYAVQLISRGAINKSGVISDRFSRRKILMTADLVCGFFVWLFLS
ncbi:macrolide efflux ABC transporter membrane-spanning permease [Streptococcus pneumoniae]|nr:macrolide efflux ABC transporter membrane-spanning permease [Streptococcus pneumoniae]VQR34150.1 macrolide efflux ABC transporter membrane-spanning permease [Streptococcus pneumoniae]